MGASVSVLAGAAGEVRMTPSYTVCWSGADRYVSLTKPEGWTQRENDLLRQAPGSTGYYNLGYEQEKARKAARPIVVQPDRRCWCGNKAEAKRLRCLACRKAKRRGPRPVAA